MNCFESKAASSKAATGLATTATASSTDAGGITTFASTITAGIAVATRIGFPASSVSCR